MERAKQLREERKNGSVSASSSGSVFKNAGQDTVHRQRQNSFNGRSQQMTQMSGANGIETTATSILSSPSIQGDRMGVPPGA